MKKGSKIAIIIIGVILLMSIALYNMLKFGGNYKNPYNKKEVDLSKLVKNIEHVQFENGKIVLKSSDVNELLNVYFKQEKNMGNIKVKGALINTKGDDLDVKIPFRYKNADLLLDFTGKVSAEESKLVYNVNKVKLGKVSIPKRFLLDKIKQKKLTGIDISGNHILLDQSDFYFKVKDIEIENDKIYITIK